LFGVRAPAQESLISRPAELLPTPVYLTQPVEGRVDIGNLPPVQDVRITGGNLEGPVEVQGDLEFRVPEPLLVEVANPPEFPDLVEVKGTVRVDDTQLLPVRVLNFPEPEPPASPQFAAYAFQSAFTSKEAKTRRSFVPPAGSVFHLTDLTIDARSDAALKVRLSALPAAVLGAVAGGGSDALPLAVLDTRTGPVTRLGTPAPLAGEFFVEVEALGGRGQGAPFHLVASGYLLPARK
jgi:hypothetical protein